jgi:hypothetical protein
MPVDCHLDRFGFGHGEPIFVSDVIHAHDLFPRCQSIVSAPAERRQLCRLDVIAIRAVIRAMVRVLSRDGSRKVASTERAIPACQGQKNGSTGAPPLGSLQ